GEFISRSSPERIGDNRATATNRPALCLDMDFRGHPRRPLRLAAADVLAPDLRVAGLELLHRGDAAEVVEQHDLDALRPQEAQVAREGAGLAHHHPRYLEEQDRAGAHLARGQRGVHGGVRVGGAAARVPQRGDLTVRHRVAVLHPLVVPGRDHPVPRREDRAHRDATRVEAGPRLLERERHHFPVEPEHVTHERIRYRPRARTQGRGPSSPVPQRRCGWRGAVPPSRCLGTGRRGRTDAGLTGGHSYTSSSPTLSLAHRAASTWSALAAAARAAGGGRAMTSAGSAPGSTTGTTESFIRAILLISPGDS